MSVSEERAPGSLSDATLPRGRLGPAAREVLACLACGALALAVAAVVLELWRGSPRIPIVQPVGDGATAIAVFKGIIDNGWFISNPDLGAPFGQKNYDFSTTFGDFWNLAIVRVAALFSSDPALVTNAFYLLGYVLTAMSAHAALRVLRFSLPVAVACGVLFGLLPFHLLRTDAHLLLTMYWSVPLGALLVLGVLGHVALYERRAGARLRGWATPATARTAAIVVLVGGAGVYYAAFTLMLLVAATISAGLLGRGRRAVQAGVATTGALVASVLVYLSPSIVYTRLNGANELVGMRPPSDSLLFGLTGFQLLLPPANHRLEGLGGALREFGATSPLQAEGSSPYLGLLLGGAFLVGVGRLVLGRRRAGRDLVADSSMMALVAFLLATIGGLSAVIAYLVTPQIRGWNRISVTLAFFALVVLAVGLEHLRRRLLARAPSAPMLVWVAAAVVVVVGVFDQSTTAKPDYELAEARWNTSSRFVRAVEAAVPAETGVLQLPYIPFPETPPPGTMIDYDHLRGYLGSTDLRFSYGAMKGRPEDFGAQTAGLAPAELVRAAAAAGFGVVWVDRAGYADGGRALEQEIAAVGDGAPPIVSDDGRFAAHLIAGVATATAPARRRAVTDALLPARRARTRSGGAGRSWRPR